jgi:hypothetical protein
LIFTKKKQEGLGEKPGFEGFCATASSIFFIKNQGSKIFRKALFYL